jgi:hypothetical protein
VNAELLGWVCRRVGRCAVIASWLAARWLALPEESGAAPPEITAIYPAGGQRGTHVTLTLQGKVDPAHLQLWCDQPGVELIGPAGKDSVELKIAADAGPGWCWLGFFNAEGAAGQRPFQIGTLPEVLEAEPNDRLIPASALNLQPAVVCNGVLDKRNDVDIFPFSLAAGQTVVVSLAARQPLGSPVDAVLQLVDARGFVLAHGDDVEEFDPRLVFTAPREGMYAVRVFGFPATPDSSIRFSSGANYVYRLTLATGPVAGWVFPPAVPANKPSTVQPIGWNLPLETRWELPPLSPGVHLLSGVHVPSGPEAVSFARVWGTPWDCLAATEENSQAQPQPVAIPACVAGRLSPQREHAWKFAAKKGEAVILKAAARELGSPLDVLLRVTDASGKLLQEVDDAPQAPVDVRLEFQPPSDGDYVAVIRDRFAHGGTDYLYALTIAPPQPEFVLSVVGDAFTFPPAKDFELTVHIEGRDGFDDEVELTVEGLPEGCTAEPVKVVPMGAGTAGRGGRRRDNAAPSNSAKLVIKTTKTDGWAGVFRVVGRTTGHTPQERYAVGRPPNSPVPRPQLLAVIPSK